MEICKIFKRKITYLKRKVKVLIKKIIISAFPNLVLKKKNPDSKLNLDIQTSKKDEITASFAFEEDLNQYYTKNQKNEVEKKFMKIQQAYIKKEDQAPTSKSMKNIFSSVKKIFS